MGTRQFIDLLAVLNYGETHTEASDKMHGLVEQCLATGKVGKLTFEVTCKPINEGAQMEIYTEITVKAPKPAKRSTLMFVSPEKNLVRDDPRQASLPGIRKIDTTPTEAKAVDTSFAPAA